MASKPFVDNKRAATEAELPAVIAWMKVAVPHLRDVANKSKGTSYIGCHANYAGLNSQFALRFPELSLNKTQKQLAAAKVTASVMGRGGPSFYLWHEKPESYSAEPTDQSEVKAQLDKLFEIRLASEAMENARRESSISDETLEKLNGRDSETDHETAAE